MHYRCTTVVVPSSFHADTLIHKSAITDVVRKRAAFIRYVIKFAANSDFFSNSHTKGCVRFYTTVRGCIMVKIKNINRNILLCNSVLHTRCIVIIIRFGCCCSQVNYLTTTIFIALCEYFLSLTSCYDLLNFLPTIVIQV